MDHFSSVVDKYNTSKDITALDIAEIIDAVKAEGHNRMAQVVRMVLIDVFKKHNTQDMFRRDLTQRRQQNNREIE